MGESETERVEEKIIGGFAVTLYLLKFEQKLMAKTA